MHETGLPAVISTSLKGKETFRRGNLARLVQTNRKKDHSFDNLSTQSKIARNQVMLEHVMATRDMRQWKDQILSELHAEQRTKSLATSQRGGHYF